MHHELIILVSACFGGHYPKDVAISRRGQELEDMKASWFRTVELDGETVPS